MSSADAFWVETRRDFLMVSGPDAETYLHSQLSQEVRGLAVGAAVWSFVLEPTGKVDALVRVVRSGDSAFVLDTDAGWGERLLTRLLRFRIRVKAEIEPIEWRCLAVRGARPAPTPGAVAVPGWRGEGVDLLGPAPQPPPGVRAGSPADHERARVLAGWPAFGVDVEEGAIPGETGLVDVAVSFTKGCYPGQELVERMDSRGASAPRRLCRVVLPVEVGAAVGVPLRVDGAEVGRLTSVAGDAGLAVVARSAAVPGEALLALPNGDQPVTLQPLTPLTP